MGFLLDIINALEEPTEGEQVLIEAICLAAAADDEFTDLEMEVCVGYVKSLLSMSQEDAENYVSETIEYFQEVGFDEAYENLIATLEDFDHDVTRAAFVAVAGVSLIDGEVNWEEEEFITGLTEALEISDEERAELTAIAKKMIASA